jgi:hypothetical protein
VRDGNTVLVMEPTRCANGGSMCMLTNFMSFTSLQTRLIFGGRRMEGAVDQETMRNSMLFPADASVGRMATVVRGTMVLSDVARALVLCPARLGTLTLADVLHVDASMYNVFRGDLVTRLETGMIVVLYNPLEVSSTMEPIDLIGKCPLWIFCVFAERELPDAEVVKFVTGARQVFQHNVLTRVGALVTRTQVKMQSGQSPTPVLRRALPVTYHMSDSCRKIHIADITHVPDEHMAIRGLAATDDVMCATVLDKGPVLPIIKTSASIVAIDALVPTSDSTSACRAQRCDGADNSMHTTGKGVENTAVPRTPPACVALRPTPSRRRVRDQARPDSSSVRQSKRACVGTGTPRMLVFRGMGA